MDAQSKPDSSKVLTLMEQGIVHHRAGRFHDAEMCYRFAVTQDRNCAAGWHLLGMIADEAGHADQAIELIRHAISLSPDQPEMHNNLGVICEQNGEYSQAEQCFRSAIHIKPSYAFAYNNLGEVMKGQIKGVGSEYHFLNRLTLTLRRH